ncbi:hypothetical protein R6Q57_018313 [Mikania cordata]
MRHRPDPEFHSLSNVMQNLKSILCDKTRFAFEIHRFEDGREAAGSLPAINSLFITIVSRSYGYFLNPSFCYLVCSFSLSCPKAILEVKRTITLNFEKITKTFQFFDMGSLDIKSNPKVTNNQSESVVDSTTTFDENDLLELISEHSSASDSDDNEFMVHFPTFDEEKTSCSSSTSSSNFMLEDTFQNSDYSNGEKTNKDVVDYTIESPPVQMMERVSPTSQKYRIPSSVFSRKESNIDGWGMASNESLFSIHMGGLSFRNQDSMSWRPGELDFGYGIEPSLVEVGMIPELDETCESDASENLDEADIDQDFVEGRYHKLGKEDKIQSLSEISNNHGSRIADEPMNLNTQSEPGSKSDVEDLNPHFSAENVGRGSSFAFPILTGHTTGSRTEKSEPQSDTQPHSEPQLESDKQTEPSGLKADPPAATWTNCFGCCTLCS